MRIYGGDGTLMPGQIELLAEKATAYAEEVVGGVSGVSGAEALVKGWIAEAGKTLGA